MWPILHPPGMSVLHWIEMDVIDVPLKVRFIAQRALPLTPLPNTALAFGDAARRDTFAAWQTPGKGGFDQPPSQREVGVIFGQCPDRMQMVGKDNNRIDLEWMASPGISECYAQQIDMPNEETQITISQVHSEKETASGKEVPSIIGHSPSIAKQ